MNILYMFFYFVRGFDYHSFAVERPHQKYKQFNLILYFTYSGSHCVNFVSLCFPNISGELRRAAILSGRLESQISATKWFGNLV